MARYVVESEDGDGVPIRASTAEAAHRASRRSGMVGSTVNRAEAEAQQAPFKSLFDLHRTLDDWRSGWKLVKPRGEGGEYEKEYEVFQKRYGSAWYKITFDPFSPWSKSATISPAHSRRLKVEDWEKARDRITAHLEVRDLTLADVERVVQGLVVEYKKILSPRKKRETKWAAWRPRYGSDGAETRWSTDELEGDAAVAAWKRDVRIKLLELVDAFGRVSVMPDTSLLVGDLLDNYGWKIDGMSRGWMASTIKGILESLAKAGKIERSPVRSNKVEWISHQYVPKARW